MIVYIVKTLVNSEFGHYNNYKIFDSLEKAQNEIDELGNNKVNVWFNDNGIDQFIIEECDVY